MHLAEGTLPLAHALGWSALAVPPLLWSIRGARDPRAGARSDRGVLIAGATSLLFAATLLPVPVPIAGATSHICMTPVLALLVGVRHVVWPTFFVLLVQALFFAHGGITTLGANTLTLGVLAPAFAVAAAWTLRRIGLRTAVAVGVACALADLGVYVADAAVLSLALAAEVDPTRTLTAVLIGFAPVQLPLAVLEGAIAVGLVRVLARRRPELLPAWLRPEAPPVTAGPPGLAVLAVVLALATTACDYAGIDDSVFGAAATEAGRPPTASVVDGSGGEVGTAISIIVLFGLGFVAGRAYERLLVRPRALPR